jgi:hypothetical protein
MRRTPILILTAVALSAAGCGDTPQSVLRDVISFHNELADMALRVTDDASAKETREGRLKRMKDRQEWIKSRLDKIKEDRKKLQAFTDAMQDNTEEIQAGAAYLTRAANWLRTVGGEANSLAQEIEGLANITLPEAPVQKQNNPGG